MTRMHEQKTELLTQAIKSIKALRHLTGNNQLVSEAQNALEGLGAVI